MCVSCTRYVRKERATHEFCFMYLVIGIGLPVLGYWCCSNLFYGVLTGDGVFVSVSWEYIVPPVPLLNPINHLLNTINHLAMFPVSGGLD